MAAALRSSKQLQKVKERMEMRIYRSYQIERERALIMMKERGSRDLETFQSVPVLRALCGCYASRLSHRVVKIRLVSDLKSALFFSLLKLENSGNFKLNIRRQKPQNLTKFLNLKSFTHQLFSEGQNTDISIDARAQEVYHFKL